MFLSLAPLAASISEIINVEHETDVKLRLSKNLQWKYLRIRKGWSIGVGAIR